MKLEQSFEVAAPLERVWEALIDVERVAPCLPGASVTGKNEDGTYTGEFKVKIGPTSAAYSGKLNMENVDAEAHTATMQASGTDRRGQGGAKATIISSVAAEADGQARVDVSTDYHITGRLARFGRGGMIEEISNRLLGEFAKNLQAMLADGHWETAAAEAPAVETAAPEVPEEAPVEETPAAEAPEETPAEDTPTTESLPPEPPSTESDEDASTAAGEDAPVEAAPPEAVAEPDAVMEGATPVASPAEDEPAASPPDEHASDAASATPRSTPSTGSAPETEPISALSIVGSVALKRIKENPAPLAALVVGFLVALRVLRRRS
jgi:carbon monoxide dehydrogenase subunit G